MVLEHQSLELYGQMLFEKAVVKTPFKKPYPMPNEACFLYVLEGENNSFSEQEEVRTIEGESVLMKCGHYLTQAFSRKKEGRYHAIAVHFYPEMLKKIYDNDLPSFLKKNNFTFYSNMVKLKASTLIKKYIESLLFYFENPQLVTEDILVLKLKEIILLLLQTENSPKVIEILTNLFSPKTFSFKEIIEAHIFSSISISELAQLTHHSLSSFKREFKKIYNDTPANYIRNRRIEKGAKMLLLSDDPISHIAYDCCFQDIAHFSKSFKAKYGQSPSAYRLAFKDK